MNSYLAGILAAFVEPVFHAWANILDSYATNNVLGKITPLLFFSNIVGIFLVPAIWILAPPARISCSTALILLIVALTEVLYLFPYYMALRVADTSVVASLFSLGTIFVPFLAFVFAGERLNGPEYLGICILVSTSVLLSLDLRKMRFNRAFILMLIVALDLALQSVLLKHVYELGVSWSTSTIWVISLQLLITSILMCSPTNRAVSKDALRRVISRGPLFFGMELLGWGGNMGSSYAIYLLPVSVVRGIASTQPIFVLLFTIVLGTIGTSTCRERLEAPDTAKKIILFVFAVVGILLISGV